MWSKIAGAVAGPLANVLIEKLLKPFFKFLAGSINKAIEAVRNKIQLKKHHKENKKKVDTYKDSKTKDSARDAFNKL